MKKSYNKYNDVEFIVNQNSILESMLNENQDMIPRFSLKDLEIFNDLPVNVPVKYSRDLALKAVKYGLIMLVNYKGAYDNNFSGHERVLYFMVLGFSSKNKELIRGYHLNGWSVSQNNNIEKKWRMFRSDRILSMTFTGSFFRLPPDGYKPDDKGMKGGIILSADFDSIRRRQKSLVDKRKIQKREDVSLSSEGNKTPLIEIKNTNTELDLNNFLDNDIIKSIKDLDNIRISFLKNVYKKDYLAIIGALGKTNDMVKLKETKGKTIGNYKILDSAVGRDLKNIKKVKGNPIFNLYEFVRKK